MTWIFIVVLGLLLLGPLRRRFLFPLLSAWRIVIPVAGGFIAGSVLAGMMVSLGAPAWMLVFGLLAGVFIIGSEGRKWFYDNFPPKGK